MAESTTTTTTTTTTALTSEDVLEVINGIPGMTKDKLRATLTIGALTTEVSRLDALIEQARLRDQADRTAHQQAVNALQSAKDDVNARLRALLGA